jgi:hypothetical protein
MVLAAHCLRHAAAGHLPCGYGQRPSEGYAGLRRALAMTPVRIVQKDLPESQFDTPLDYAAFSAIGSMLGMASSVSSMIQLT